MDAKDMNCNSDQSHEHSYTCDECMNVLHMVIDKETDANEEFKQHLKDCLPCLEKYNLDSAIKEVLAKKCDQHEPPQKLVQEIKDKIFNNVE